MNITIFRVSYVQKRVFVSPLAKTILRESGVSIDLSSLSGSGPNGRVIAKDVLAAIASKTTPAATPATTTATTPTPTPTPAMTMAATTGVSAYEDIPVTPMRKVISTRLSESKQTIPHYYVNQNCYVDELLKVGLICNMKKYY